jgi:iron complex transport system permease protein
VAVVRQRSLRLLLLAGAVALLATCVLLSLAAGSRPLPPIAVLRALTSPDGSDASVIVRELRLPRTAVGLVVGAAVGVAGAQLQGVTRNPLADPGLLGVSAGAALGVVLLTTAAGAVAGAALGWAALAGALLATTVVWALAGSGRSAANPLNLVLAGVALTALLSSVTTVLVLLDAETLDAYRFWVVGSLAGRDPALLVSVLPLLLAGAGLAVATARTLDLLALGDDLARGLGARLAWGRAGVGLSATLLTAAATAVAGPLAFVGLTVPHVARALTGPAARWLLPVSALLGASLVLAADVLGRVVARPAEVQVGVVTAVLGAPVLVAVVRRRRLA